MTFDDEKSAWEKIFATQKMLSPDFTSDDFDELVVQWSNFYVLIPDNLTESDQEDFYQKCRLFFLGIVPTNSNDLKIWLAARKMSPTKEVSNELTVKRTEYLEEYQGMKNKLYFLTNAPIPLPKYTRPDVNLNKANLKAKFHLRYKKQLIAGLLITAIALAVFTSIALLLLFPPAGLAGIIGTGGVIATSLGLGSLPALAWATVGGVTLTSMILSIGVAAGIIIKETVSTSLAVITKLMSLKVKANCHQEDVQDKDFVIEKKQRFVTLSPIIPSKKITNEMYGQTKINYSFINNQTKPSTEKKPELIKQQSSLQTCDV